MIPLNIRFLGTACITTDQEKVHIDRRKALALLAYLAVQNAPVARCALALLLYPDHNHSDGLTRIRRLLVTLNQTPLQDYLEIDRDHIRLIQHPMLNVDIWQLSRVYQQLRRKESSEHPTDLSINSLYPGGFLEGFTIRNSADFDNWQSIQSQTYEDIYLYILKATLQQCIQNEDVHSAIHVLQKRIHIDEYNEELYVELAQLYARTNQRARALFHIENCIHMLDTELGILPSPQLMTLKRSIEKGVTLPYAYNEI